MALLGHEKLRAYQDAVSFAAWVQTVLTGIDQKAAVVDQFDRASESIVENIANGNSRRGASDRNRYFDFAVGSGLECAACLDVCSCKNFITPGTLTQGKTVLRGVVAMVIGLRKVANPAVRESSDTYGSKEDPNRGVYFAHETLDVYQVALELVRWLDKYTRGHEVGSRYVIRLDKESTSIALNIAEGNGRFCHLDHRRFIDIAHTGAMEVASSLDMLVARRLASKQEIDGGKQLLVRLVPLLMGMRGYLEGQSLS